jgi:phosphocarrier protein HPr
MVEKEVIVTNTLGIHARPASLIVQTAGKFKSAVHIHKDDVIADAKSIMSVMMLAAAWNCSVRIKASGPDEREALEAVTKLFESRFGEQ